MYIYIYIYIYTNRTELHPVSQQPPGPDCRHCEADTFWRIAQSGLKSIEDMKEASFIGL